MPIAEAREVMRYSLNRSATITTSVDEAITAWRPPPRVLQNATIRRETSAEAIARLTAIAESDAPLATKVAIESSVEVAPSLTEDVTEVTYPADILENLHEHFHYIHNVKRQKREDGVSMTVSYDDDAVGSILYFVSTDCHRVEVTVEASRTATCPQGRAAEDAAEAAAAVLPPFVPPLENMVSTFSGSGPVGDSVDAFAVHAERSTVEVGEVVSGGKAVFSLVTGIAVDPQAKAVYVIETSADANPLAYTRDRLTRLDYRANTEYITSGDIGYSDGPSTKAKFNHAMGLTVDPRSGIVYVADSGNHVIRAYERRKNQVSIVAGTIEDEHPEAGFRDGEAAEARFDNPEGIAIDSEDAKLYVADTDNHRIRTIDLSTMQVSTLAGGANAGSRDGRGVQARFNHPSALALDGEGRILYVSDSGNHAIRYIKLGDSGDSSSSDVQVLSLVGGSVPGLCDGDVTTASFVNVAGLWHDPVNDVLYATDVNRIRAIAGVGHKYHGSVLTVAGSSEEGLKDGAGSDAQFSLLLGVSGDADRRILYATDHENRRIRTLTLNGYKPESAHAEEL